VKLRGGAPRFDLSESRWLVLTSGMGSEDFEAAASRVVSQATRLPGVTRAIAVTTKDLSEVCPMTTKLYGHLQNHAHRGWGYWAYKSEIISRAFDGYWGDFEGYIWIDSGCEVFVNPISARRFKIFQQRALQTGVTVFTLKTPESLYTKNLLFREFPELNPLDSTDQIQNTFYLLSGEKGKVIADRWLMTTLISTAHSDDSTSAISEPINFVRNTGDQSVFSLVCKSEGITPMKYTPATGTNSIIGKFRAFSHPIWVSRNRTGKSVIPKFLQKISSLY
jgi:hypothetical protein